jgi:hypothetical protein
MSGSYVESGERAATLAKVANRTEMREDARLTKVPLPERCHPTFARVRG